MGVLGVLGTLGTLDLSVAYTGGNFEQLPQLFKEYGKNTLSICYNPSELEQKAEEIGMTDELILIFSDQIKKEKNYSNRLDGSVQLLSLVYCSFFKPQEIQSDINHKKFLKALQGLELETLIIDQAIDNPEKYRDLDLRTTNTRVLYSIVSGDLYKTIQNTKIPETNKFDLINKWNKILGDIYVGQSIDLLYTNNGPISEEKYLKMIQKTTANFVEYSATLGATYSRLSQEEISAAEAFGFDIGTAFQIRDDWEDMEKDILEGKSRAFVTKEALKWLPENYRDFVNKNLRERKEETIQLIKESAIPVYVKELNNQYVDNAEKHIQKINSFETKEKLGEIANIIRI